LLAGLYVTVRFGLLRLWLRTDLSIAFNAGARISSFVFAV